MWHFAFAFALSAGIAAALLMPHHLIEFKVDTNLTIGTAYLSLGLGSSAVKYVHLFGAPLGLGNISFSFFMGTFLWPALGLAVTTLVLQAGLPVAVAVGFVLLSACPVGPSAAINALTAGGSLECSLLMCFLTTPAALLTFPYIYRHFILFLLDQPATAAAADARLRAKISLPELPATAMAALFNHALVFSALPLATGVVLGALLPSKVVTKARRLGPITAAALLVLAVSLKVAEGAEAVRTAGAPVFAGVAALHLAALLFGYLIPAAVNSPGKTCRTTAYQASLRNSALGLGLAAALFSGSEHFVLAAAPCTISLCCQELLGACTALLGYRWPARHPVSDSGLPASPRAFRANSAESILRQPTFRRTAEHSSFHVKEE